MASSRRTAILGYRSSPGHDPLGSLSPCYDEHLDPTRSHLLLTGNLMVNPRPGYLQPRFRTA